MSVRTALRVPLRHRPGELGRIARALADAHVRLEAFAGLARGTESMVELLPVNPAHATKALQAAGWTVEEVDVALAWLPDEPASLARACETLGAAGISIDAVYILTTNPAHGQHVAFECADAHRADQLLWALIY